MSYLLLRGRVENVLRFSERTDRKTGELRDAYQQVQFMVTEPLRDGQSRLDIKTLSVDDVGPFEALKGSECLVEVGCYVKAGGVAFFAKKGSKPIPVRAPDRAAERPAGAPAG